MVMEEECCVPPGFRFHPTEEELVGYYLARKVASQSIDLDIIQEVDLYRMEPWDLQGLVNKQQQGEGDEWYFFSHKDRKYPSGTRTNRATAAGFWKATGRDKPVLSSSRSSAGSRVIGMRKTLVFYKGRAPNGRKTDWIMHEYRLQCSSDVDDPLLLPPPQQEEGWVVCRAFRKPIPNQQQQRHPCLLPYHHPIPSSTGYGSSDHHHCFLGSTSSSLPLFYPPETRGEILSHQLYNNNPNNHAEANDLFESKNSKQHLLLSIPQLIDSPTAAVDDDELLMIQQQRGGGGGGGGGGQAAAGAIDWNFLDTLLLSSTVLHDNPAPASSSSSLQLQ